jgi:spore maturation protein CgeB
VTQRDKWEDHYRLFEALVTGPFVITDRVLSLPQGLQNGTSVIECTSAEDLRSKIIYFLAHPEERLAIARHDRFVAMTRHRSWHRIEEIIFGSSVTQCSEKRESLSLYCTCE